jgi:hypothetical protein
MSATRTSLNLSSRATAKAAAAESAKRVTTRNDEPGNTESVNSSIARSSSCKTGAAGFAGRKSKSCLSTTSTEKVRGLLCSECNAGLGLLGDSIEGVQKALEYLRRYEVRKMRNHSRESA